MKYNRNWKVEFKTRHVPYTQTRNVYYRVVPSELNWFQRKFCNKWKIMLRALKVFGGTIDMFSFDEYKKNIFPLKTIGDVQDYLEAQKRIGDAQTEYMEKKKRERIEKGEEWPD